MKIIICGCGDVGLSIAQYLSEDYEVVLVDESPRALSEAAEKLDVQTIVGNASDPTVLKQADAGKAGVIIAVTSSDEVNIITCQLAQLLFNIPLKIARLQSHTHDYEDWETYRHKYLPIDIMISQEGEATQEIMQHLNAPFAFQVFTMGEKRLHILGIRILEKSPFVDIPLTHLEKLASEIDIAAICIMRGDKSFIPQENDKILEGDNVYFVVPSDQLKRFTELAGFQGQQCKRVVILGGGRIGLSVATEIENTHPDVASTLIEYKKGKTHHLASQLNRTLVLQGDALDSDILEEAGIQYADTVIAATDHDQVNILSSLLAKRHGAERSMTLVTRQSYISLMISLGVDKAINPALLTVSLILQRIRKSYVLSVHTLGPSFPEEVMEIEIQPTAQALGMAVADLSDTQELFIAAIVRHKKVLIPKESTILESHDRLIVLSGPAHTKKIKKYFEPRTQAKEG